MRKKTGPQWLALLGVIITAVVSAMYAPRPAAKVSRPNPAQASTSPVTSLAPKAGASHAETHPATPSGRTYRVVRVADGDTLELAADKEAPFRVRLQGVDCPELAQPYGDEALRFTISHVRGHEVHLTGLGTDQFGRVLGVVEVNGENLNRTLVSAGYAWCFRRYAEDPELPKLEEAARQARRGLWAQAKPEPPWDYRQQHGGRPRP